MDTESQPAVDSRFRWTAAAYLAGVMPWDVLVESALALLAATATAPNSLLALASAGGEPGKADAVALTERTLADLGLPAVDADELSTVRNEAGLRDIAAGRVAPVEGAHRLWMGRESDGDPYEVLPHLLQLVDRWESHLHERDAIDERIRAVARAAIAGTDD